MSDAKAFLESLGDERQRDDARRLASMMADVTGEQPALWGSIVGFGTLHYKYDSGREGDTMTVGFAPRKGKLVLYGIGPFDDLEDMLEMLGPHSTGKGCLYLKRLSDADPKVLEAILRKTWETRSQ